MGSCVNPGEPENGFAIQPPDYYFGSIVTFTCGENFTLVGSHSIQCVVGSTHNVVKWNATVPTCQGENIRIIISANWEMLQSICFG